MDKWDFATATHFYSAPLTPGECLEMGIPFDTHRTIIQFKNHYRVSILYDIPKIGLYDLVVFKSVSDNDTIEWFPLTSTETTDLTGYIGSPLKASREQLMQMVNKIAQLT